MLLLKSSWRLWQSTALKASAELGPTLVPLGEFSASWFRECVSLEWETVLFPNARVLVNLYFLRVVLLASLQPLELPFSLHECIARSLEPAGTFSILSRELLGKMSVFRKLCSILPVMQTTVWPIVLLLPGWDRLQWQFVTLSPARNKWWQSHLYPTPNPKPAPSFPGFCLVTFHF